MSYRDSWKWIDKISYCYKNMKTLSWKVFSWKMLIYSLKSASKKGRKVCLVAKNLKKISEVFVYVCAHHCKTSEVRSHCLLSISLWTSSVQKNHLKNWMNTFDIFFSSSWLHLRNWIDTVLSSCVQWQGRLWQIIIKIYLMLTKNIICFEKQSYSSK